MQSSIITCDVADLENVQANLISVKALLALVIVDADDRAASCKRDTFVSSSFDSISEALNGVFLLVDNIIDSSTEAINKAFKAHKAAKKGGKSNDEAEEADRA